MSQCAARRNPPRPAHDGQPPGTYVAREDLRLEAYRKLATLMNDGRSRDVVASGPTVMGRCRKRPPHCSVSPISGLSAFAWVSAT